MFCAQRQVERKFWRRTRRISRIVFLLPAKYCLNFVGQGVHQRRSKTDLRDNQSDRSFQDLEAAPSNHISPTDLVPYKPIRAFYIDLLLYHPIISLYTDLLLYNPIRAFYTDLLLYQPIRSFYTDLLPYQPIRAFYTDVLPYQTIILFYMNLLTYKPIRAFYTDLLPYKPIRLLGRSPARISEKIKSLA